MQDSKNIFLIKKKNLCKENDGSFNLTILLNIYQLNLLIYVNGSMLKSFKKLILYLCDCRDI